MIRFIENIGDYYSQHFFTDDFHKKVFEKAGYITQKKDTDGNKTDNHITEINARISPLSEKYFRFKNDLLTLQREKDKVKRTHDFHREILNALGYINGTLEYHQPVFINDTELIPVRYNYSRGGKPYLFIMEMKAIIREGDKEADGIYEQTWVREEWKEVFPTNWDDIALNPDVIKDALSELFLLPEDDRPTYVILLAGAKIFLIHYEKWKYDSYLLFDLEMLFNEVKINRDYLSLFYVLLAKSNFLSNTDNLLQSLDEDAHKAAYSVTQNLKKGVIYAVESLANEAIWYKKTSSKTYDEKQAIEKQMSEDRFARELKDECLSMVYRLLFLFYAEAREDLEILPVKDPVYQKGYSLEMLRDLELVPLTTESSRNGFFISKSLWKLFDHLHAGVKIERGFEMKPLDSPLFDNAELKHLAGVQFRNVVLQQVIKRLSLSDQSSKKRRGRISYANLGINQLGSVYESLLAFSGFFAADTLIEVKAADDPEGKEGTFLVPLTRRDDFREAEILKDPENPQQDKQMPKGHFVYRLNGRDRKKSASFYTPEVLTQTTVRYTLKGIIDRIKEFQEKGEEGEKGADQLLNLKILEPAMGAAAFHNEVINQLADAYLELKENEEVRKGRKRILPGKYNDELQKVKAYIAANNVYGVDLNPTAVELGKLSLWLNCMHRNMETPFFAHRLGTGNAVVGCWLNVYNEQDIILEYPKEGTTKERNTPIPKAWWALAPKRVRWGSKGYTRKTDQYYHFLLPDENMLASSGLPLIKESLTDGQRKEITNKKKEFKQPLTRQECTRLQKISIVIDTLLEEHYLQIKGIIKDTTSAYAVYGQLPPQIPLKGYDEKERLAESRNARSAPFYKLRMIMDYWCSLWFWDARKAADFPTRTEWYNEIENILGIDFSLFGDTVESAQILKQIKIQAADTWNLHGSDDRLDIIIQLREQHRFFHHELEFIEVFKEKGGFDVVVGNPPWIKLQFEEKDIIAEQFPEVLLRKTTAPQVKKMQEVYFSVADQKKGYFNELIGIEGAAQFMNALQNYPLLVGQQTNLYKCVLENGFSLISKAGFMGLIHPEGIYDDPKGQLLRKETYTRLKYHFQFQNAFNLFAEVAHREKYGIQIYSGYTGEISFKSINNIFHPSTIEGSFIHDGTGICGGIKIKGNDEDGFGWNIAPHKDRIVNFNESRLKILAQTFENSNDGTSAKLVSIHSSTILLVLDKLSQYKTSVNNFKFMISEGWHETNDLNAGIIRRETKYPNSSFFEMIYSGPHFFVSNPLYKTPREICIEKADYSTLNLTKLPEDYFSRTNYLPGLDTISFLELFDVFEGENWIDYYKVGFRKMLSQAGERTLICAILPPASSHTNGVISVIFKSQNLLLEFMSLASSLVLDFFIKTVGASNLYESRINSFPLGIENKFKHQLFSRTLLLNCLNIHYAPLWQENWHEAYAQDQWSKDDQRLKPFTALAQEWNWHTPLRNSYERRLSLVEVDVITAMALGLTLDELCLIYNVQFPVLQQNEDDTWYDQKGNIIFTCSKGLVGVGIDRPEWDKISVEVNSMQRTLKDGSTYTHTITKSELYLGQQITYYPPFDKCDRVADYQVAWAHFEQIFKNETLSATLV